MLAAEMIIIPAWVYWIVTIGLISGLILLSIEKKFTPKLMIWLGTALMIMGIIFPFLMVIKLVESTFFLNFFSYGASLGGMMMATIGIAYISITRRRERT